MASYRAGSYPVLAGGERVEASHEHAAAVRVLYEGGHAVLAGAGEGAGEELGVPGVPSHSAYQRLEDLGPGPSNKTCIYIIK